MHLLVTNIGRLVTATSAGVLTRAAVLVDGERIIWMGSADERPPRDPDKTIDVGGALVTPGLIDAHTHPVYAGDRLEEIARRSAGASYEEVTAGGGGIRATVTATRAASRNDLLRLVTARLASWLANGTTTVEAKTGYHLDHDGELAAVALLAGLSRPSAAPPSGTGSRPAAAAAPVQPSPASAPGAGPYAALPRVEVTFLGAHDVGPEYAGRSGGHADYADAVARWCPEAARAGARFVDVFCDTGYFSLDQARRVLRAGASAGLRPRVHADELARTGASLLAAEAGAVSADHLLCATEEDAKALAAAGVVVTLCPVTALALGRLPPTRALVDHGVTVALGSDHNPGQSGTTSMSLVIGLAVHVLGLPVAEALTAATAGAAAAVLAPDRGRIGPGMLADLVAWDADHEGAFAWDLGLTPRLVLKGGVTVAGETGERPT